MCGEGATGCNTAVRSNPSVLAFLLLKFTYAQPFMIYWRAFQGLLESVQQCHNPLVGLQLSAAMARLLQEVEHELHRLVVMLYSVKVLKQHRVRGSISTTWLWFLARYDAKGFFCMKINIIRRCYGGKAGRIAASQLQGSRSRLEFGILSVCGFACSACGLPLGFSSFLPPAKNMLESGLDMLTCF